MKELESINADQVKIVNQKEIEKHRELFAQQKLHKGHIMWEIDCTTGEIRAAEYSKEVIKIVPTYDINVKMIYEAMGKTPPSTGSTAKTVRDIISKDNCVYIGALNKKRAKIKFDEWLLQRLSENVKQQLQNHHESTQENIKEKK